MIFASKLLRAGKYTEVDGVRYFPVTKPNPSGKVQLTEPLTWEEIATEQEYLDPAIVAAYVADIEAGRPIDLLEVSPVVTPEDPEKEYAGKRFLFDGHHRKAALKKLNKQRFAAAEVDL